MKRAYFTRTGVAIRVIDGGLNWDGTPKEDLSHIEAVAPKTDSQIEADFYNVAGGQNEASQGDTCPSCGSSNVSNEDGGTEFGLQISCHDCSHQWVDQNETTEPETEHLTWFERLILRWVG